MTTRSPADPFTDPLSSVVALLRPQPAISKMVEASGRWLVERTDLRSPFYAAIVEGRTRLTIESRAPVMLEAGDFVLIPEVERFTMTSEATTTLGAARLPLETGPGTYRLGPVEKTVEMRALIGHCRFAAAEKVLLLSLLPEMVHLSGHERLLTLVPLIHDETQSNRPGRAMILERLLEVLMIEALRANSSAGHPPGLSRGLSDPRLVGPLSLIHNDVGRSLSVEDLAREAGMSRSAFYDRFRRALGVAPKEYVMGWRMAVARDLLLRGNLTNAEIAHRVGYGSASAFCMAFVRHQGMAPGAFAAAHAAG